MITNAIIRGLNPCKDRYDNYLKFYGLNSQHTKAQFMGLKNITHEDKLWIAFRLMPKKNIVLAAADIAESVLYIWEAEYPQDLRPRKAIEAARTGVDAPYAATTAANAASAAYTYSAYAASAATAAYTSIYASATYAATTYSAYATNAVAYAAYATAANAAIYTHVGGDRKVQEKLIRKIILKYWK